MEGGRRPEVLEPREMEDLRAVRVHARTYITQSAPRQLINENSKCTHVITYNIRFGAGADPEYASNQNCTYAIFARPLLPYRAHRVRSVTKFLPGVQRPVLFVADCRPCWRVGKLHKTKSDQSDQGSGEKRVFCDKHTCLKSGNGVGARGGRGRTGRVPKFTHFEGPRVIRDPTKRSRRNSRVHYSVQVNYTRVELHDIIMEIDIRSSRHRTQKRPNTYVFLK